MILLVIHILPSMEEEIDTYFHSTADPLYTQQAAAAVHVKKERKIDAVSIA